jgi:hypothetical protein
LKNHLPPQSVIEQAWDYVEQFICPIQFIREGDNRTPPGDHHGTGWFVEKHGVVHICTCEHVANFQDKGKIGYAPFGGDCGINVGRQFFVEAHPVDFAIADASRTWILISHKGKCIPLESFDKKHQPVEGEYLYLQGFPGADSQAIWGQHNVKGLGAYLHEVEPPSELFSEHPPFKAGYHICMAWNPANATSLTEAAIDLSAPGGLSGSVLWNTRYQEVSGQGRNWSVNDMRVTGIVWGASSKAGVITATPIEHILQFIV